MPANAPPRSAQAQPVYFNTDVVPLLTKLGCNSGGCHGKAAGQNGFKLSLLGYEPDQDYEAIVQEARGRRLLPARPGEPAPAQGDRTLAHGGGKRLTVGSEDYQTILRWIENGAPPASLPTRCLRGSPSRPTERTFDAGNRRQPLRVTAHFSDGTSRDVTRQAVYQSNEPDIAEVSDTGVVQVKNRSGLFAVMVRYADQIAVFHGTVPHTTKEAGSDRVLTAWEKANTGRASTSISRPSGSGWASCRRGRPPTSEFIRRASLDICGTLPTPDEVKAYVADTRPGQAGPADRPAARTAGVRQLLRPEVGRHPAESRPGLQHQPAAPGHRPVRRLDSRLPSPPTCPTTASWPRSSRRRAARRPTRRRSGIAPCAPRRITWNRWRRRSSAFASSVPSAITTRRSAGARPTITSWPPSSPASAARAASPTPRCPRAKRSTWPTRARFSIRGPGR